MPRLTSHILTNTIASPAKQVNEGQLGAGYAPLASLKGSAGRAQRLFSFQGSFRQRDPAQTKSRATKDDDGAGFGQTVFGRLLDDARARPKVAGVVFSPASIAANRTERAHSDSESPSARASRPRARPHQVDEFEAAKRFF